MLLKEERRGFMKYHTKEQTAMKGFEYLVVKIFHNQIVLMMFLYSTLNLLGKE